MRYIARNLNRILHRAFDCIINSSFIHNLKRPQYTAQYCTIFIIPSCSQTTQILHNTAQYCAVLRNTVNQNIAIV